MRNGAALIQEAITAGLIGAGNENSFADELRRLIRAELLRFGSTNGGHHSPPEGALWNAAEVQAHGDYELTAIGRQEARAATESLATRRSPLSDAGRGPEESSDMWFHVHLWVRDSARTNQGRGTNFFNLRRDDLIGRIVGPWDRGEAIMWDGQQVPVSELTSIIIRTTEDRLPSDGGFPTDSDVTNEWIVGLPGRLASSPSPASSSAPLDSRRVMVVHGRNSAARSAMFSFLRALGLSPIEWDQAIAETGQGSPHNLEAVRAAMQASQAVVVLLTAEDRAGLLPDLSGTPADHELQGQPRQNVLLEAGLAMGISPDRTILVQLGPLRLASDFDGLNAVRLTNDPERRSALRTRLASAGCPVDDSGTDWLGASGGGDFDGTIVSSE